MRVAQVIGRVTLSIQDPSFKGGRWLMVNPLDAFRIQALFAMEQIPAEAANKTPLAAWWLTHASLWFALLAVFWSAALLLLTTLRLERTEI